MTQHFSLDVPGVLQPVGLICMAAAHIGLLVFWRLMSRKEGND